MNSEILGISIYVLAMLIMGFYVSKRIKTNDDYFLGGRTLGPFLTTFSIFATWFGAETCIGTAGAVYREGLSSIHADPLGYAACILLMGVFFAKVLWKKKITTIPDLFRERFSPATEKLAAILLVPSSIIWAGAQIRAFGQIIHSTTDYGFTIAVTVAAVVVIIYTVSGGMLADAYTDLIQGFALIAGLAFLLIAMIWDMGGIEKSFATIDVSRLNVFGGHEDRSFLGRLELWMVPIMGSLMAQELVSRVLASRSETIAANSCYRAGGMYLLVGFIPVLVGLLGLHYMPNLHDTETIMPLLAKTHLSYFFYIIFVGALVSAILSTVDSTLLSASALFSHNLIYPSLNNLTERKKVLIARGGVLVSGFIAYGIAFTSDSITELVELASGLGGPSILVMTLVALYVKRGHAVHAIFAICMSIVTWGVCHFVFEMEFPVLMTVVMCMLSYFVSSFFGDKRVYAES